MMTERESMMADDIVIENEFQLITPQMARDYLVFNGGNRAVRQRWVDYLAHCIKRGEWVVTHQGIAFSRDGRLLDGQHRLLAIIKADAPAPLMVTRGWDASAFEFIDNGKARSDSDRTSIPKSSLECVKFFMEFIGVSRDVGATPAQLREWHDVIEPYCALIRSKTSSIAKLFSSVASRSAVIASIMLGEDRDYVLDLYRDLVLSNVVDLPPIARSALKQFMSGSFSALGGGERIRKENFLRFMVLYKRENRDKPILVVRDRDEVIRVLKRKLFVCFAKDDCYQDSPPSRKDAQTRIDVLSVTP